MSPTLVILAAGAGRRYGGLKQLAPIGPGGETLLEYSAFDALRAGFGRAILVIRPDTEPEFRERIDRGMARHLSVRYVHQALGGLPGEMTPPPGRTRPWGTAHALLTAAAQLDGPFAVLNADDLYGRRSLETVASALSGDDGAPPCEAVLIGFELARTLSASGPVSRALCRLDGVGRLAGIVELERVWRQNGRIVSSDSTGVERTLTGDELVSMNLWGFSPAFFHPVRRHFEAFLRRTGPDRESEFRLPDVVQSLITGGARVDVRPAAGEWCGVTFREDRERAAATIAELIRQGTYPKELWA